MVIRRCMQIMSLLLAGGAFAVESMTLGEALADLRERGFDIVYSTDLVDENAPVELPASPLTVRRLEAILQQRDLGLESVGRRKWIVVSRPPPDEETKSSTDGAGVDYLEHIVVTASTHEIEGREQTSHYRITDADMEQTPAFAGDAMRVIHRLPGAATIGVSSKPNVRGGNSDELLVVFDGVELVEPFHLRDFQALLSTINPQTVRNIEYFTGGFPAEYGNKMSGVLDVSTKDSFASSGGGELGISTFATSGLYYRESMDTRWLLSARRGNLDLLLDRVNPSLGTPRYHDVYGYVTHELHNGGRIKVGALGFYDDARLDTDEMFADSNVDNRYLWLEWSADLGGKLHLSSRAAVARVGARRFGRTFAEDRSNGTLFDHQDLEIRSFKQGLEWKPSDRIKLSGGMSISDLEMDYLTRVAADKGVVAELLGLPTEVRHKVDRTVDGTATGLHLSTKFNVGAGVSIQSGVRLDWQSYLDVDTEFQFSPRLAVLYEPYETLSLRFSFGRFHQPPGIHEMETADGDAGFTEIQQADHWIVGAEYQSKFGRIVVEAFYKSMHDVKHRYENLFNPYVLLPELEPDRILIRPAKARARGVEIGYYGERADFRWTVNYSWSRVEDLVDDRWIPRRWDQTHNLNVLVSRQTGRWTVTAAGAWHTGWTMTVLPEGIPAGAFSLSRYRSNARLKDYATVDLRIAYEHPFAASTLTGFLEVTNLVSRSNKGGVDYEVSLEDDIYSLKEVDLEPVFPLVTSIGLVWRF